MGGANQGSVVYVTADGLMEPSVSRRSFESEEYRDAPSLTAFRVAFSRSCGGKEGLEAARCVSELLASKSPRGVPRSGFVDANYDPASALQVHLGGALGHCTVRSALTVTALLAMGIPGRVVQVIPQGGRGHTLLEVWDSVHGWLLLRSLFRLVDAP